MSNGFPLHPWIEHVVDSGAWRIFIWMDPKPPVNLEKFLALIAILWGFWVMLPMRSFKATAAYLVLESWCPEWTWGAVSFTLGAVAYYCASRSVLPRILRNAIFTLGLWYLFVGFIFLFFDFFNTGGPVYLAHGYACLWVTIWITGHLPR